MAGYMDADGTFGFMGGGKKKPKTWVARVSVTSVDREIPQWFLDCFEGSICLCTRPGNSRSVWTWTLVGAKAIALCEMLLPYLRLKKRRAQILLEYGDTYVGKVGRNGAPDDVVSRRIELVHELRDLNWRGKAPRKQVCDVTTG